jgi:RNA polymerase sigma factor (sigma-70 family)
MSPAVRVKVASEATVLMPSDAELLRRFATQQDQAAFAFLVRRHGPLVLGVCRRVLGHPQDAEDAFQATFLILARKAGTIRQRQSLASWLYKVAYRTALRARAGRAQRKAREHLAGEPAVIYTAQSPADDLKALLDEEVRRLPEKYRAPILLCYLQGRTNEEAARQLHCPTGTLKIRLLRARELLRRRLTRRGLALSLTLLLAALAEEASAAVPQALLHKASGAGSVSLRAQVLAEDVLRGMVRTKVKVAFAALLAVLLLAFADGLTQRAGAATTSPPMPFPARPAVPPFHLDPPGSGSESGPTLAAQEAPRQTITLPVAGAPDLCQIANTFPTRRAGGFTPTGHPAGLRRSGSW